MKCFIDGNCLCITKDDFINLQESKAIFVNLDEKEKELINQLIMQESSMSGKMETRELTKAGSNPASCNRCESFKKIGIYEMWELTKPHGTEYSKGYNDAIMDFNRLLTKYNLDSYKFPAKPASTKQDFSKSVAFDRPTHPLFVKNVKKFIKKATKK